jgi:hypothetical protein
VKSGSKRPATAAPWKWVTGSVDTNQEYIEIRYGDLNEVEPEDFIAVARIGPPHDKTFAVEFLIDASSSEHREVIEETKQELDFYLLEEGGPDPWAYAKYHCGTGANIYSPVHWEFVLPNDQLPLFADHEPSNFS